MKRKEMHILAWLLALALFLGAAAGENADLLGRAKEYFEAGDTQRAMACSTSFNSSRASSREHMIITESTIEASVITSPTMPYGGESITTRS